MIWLGSKSAPPAGDASLWWSAAARAGLAELEVQNPTDDLQVFPIAPDGSPLSLPVEWKEAPACHYITSSRS